MLDRVSCRLLNIYKMQYSIGREDVPQLQVLNFPSLTWYLGRWEEVLDEIYTSGTI
jgi:hypothetical protein